MLDDRKARLRELDRARYARRMAERAEQAAPVTGPRLTANPAKATIIRLVTGKTILPCEVPSWKC